MKVVLLHGHISPDASADDLDTLHEAAAIEAALHRAGHETCRLEFTLNLRQAVEDLRAVKPDLVFNLAESIDGSGRLVYLAPALLENLGIPFTGGSSESLMLTTGKVLAKRFMSSNGIPTPAWFTPSNAGAEDPRFYPPYIVKSPWEHASIGLSPESILKSENDLHTFLTSPAARRGEWFAERYIEGREFNISVLGGPADPIVLPAAEMTFVDFPPGKPRIVDYNAKWNEQSFEFHHTVRRFEFPPEDAALLAELTEIARRCWFLFGLSGYARVDFRVETDGRPWVLEVNVNPCISPDAGFVAASERAGLTYDQLIHFLVEKRRPGSAEEAAGLI